VSFGEVWIYLGFFLTLVAAGLGLPAPEELVVSGAGVLAGQLPDESEIDDKPVAYPTPAEVAAVLAFDPQAGSVGGLPWAALMYAGAPHELEAQDVAALLAFDPQAGSVAALPWSALSRASPPVETRNVHPQTRIRVRWWILLPVCILGVVFSDILLYTIGRRLGGWLFERSWMTRFLPADKRKRTEENFHRYGVSLLVIGRLVPGIRAPLFLTAGSMRLPLPRFLLADGLGAVVGNSLFFFLGFWLGKSIESLVGQAEEKLKPILIVVVVGLLVAFSLWHFLRHPVSTGDPQEVPLIGPQMASHMDQAEASEKAEGKDLPDAKETPQS
jgi:membrane protein DedA with SNARE-associated domain